MFSRIRLAFGLTLVLSLMTSITVFAKGSFSFITVTGPDLKETVRISDPVLTHDFFAFADYYRDKTEAPADPGAGYEIQRYYVTNGREVPFDRLHYYPDTGFVYYDGIVNGSSEYDGEWYTAKPEIKTVFEDALPKHGQSAAPASQPESVQAVAQARSDMAITRGQFVMPVIVAAGLVAVFLLTLRLRLRNQD